MEDLKKKLEQEIAALDTELRIDLPREIAKARAHGDLSENAEYHAAKERQGMVADILDRFQIVAKKDLFPNQLSGGQQQLVGIARAVVHAPSLLLADEPTGNLHSTQAREIMELFCELNRTGTTIVQVTHSEVNARFSRRIIELRDGWMTRDETLQTAPSEVGAQ